MSRLLLQALVLCIAMAHAAPALADPVEFSFGVIGHPRASTADNNTLQSSIEETDSDNLAFVAMQGIKPAQDACSDKVYLRQKSLLDGARNGLIVSLAASDWAKCPADSSKSSAVGRLARLRDLFFFDDFSLGASRIPVIRQSMIAKFRNFPENARWQIGDVMFATVNLPANNNNYVVDAGRNSEFEDRLIANRDWLSRVFTSTIKEVAEKLVALHQPGRIDYIKKFNLADSLLKKEVPAAEVTVAPQSSKAYQGDIKENSRYYCAACRKSIAEVVAKFCWNNHQRFGGKAYCRSCQSKY